VNWSLDSGRIAGAEANGDSNAEDAERGINVPERPEACTGALDRTVSAVANAVARPSVRRRDLVLIEMFRTTRPL